MASPEDIKLAEKFIKEGLQPEDISWDSSKVHLPDNADTGDIRHEMKIIQGRISEDEIEEDIW